VKEDIVHFYDIKIVLLATCDNFKLFIQGSDESIYAHIDRDVHMPQPWYVSRLKTQVLIAQRQIQTFSSSGENKNRKPD